jgi:hypothetical protein
MTSLICQKVVERIKEERIQPKSCWWFRVERFLVFSFLGIFLIIGALALSLILELGDQLELENVITRPKGWELVVSGFPYFWLAIVMIFSSLAVADFFRTRNGYRYQIKYVALSFSGAMVVMGVVFYSLGISQDIHDFLAKKVTSYSSIVQNPHSFWSQPESGLLSGIILSADSGCHCMKVIDWDRHMWDVDYSRASIKSTVHLKDGEGVKILGEPDGDRRFVAQKINPWNRGFMKMINRMDEEEVEIYHEIAPNFAR